MKRGVWSSGEIAELAALSVSPRVGARARKLLDSHLRLDGCGPAVECFGMYGGISGRSSGRAIMSESNGAGWGWI